MLQRRYGSLPVCKFLFSKQVYVRTYLSDRGSPQRCSGAGVSARGPRQGCGHWSWARSSRLRGHRARRAAKGGTLGRAASPMSLTAKRAGTTYPSCSDHTSLSTH